MKKRSLANHRDLQALSLSCTGLAGEPFASG